VQCWTSPCCRQATMASCSSEQILVCHDDFVLLVLSREWGNDPQ
jgi:hypothetical protein